MCKINESNSRILGKWYYITSSDHGVKYTQIPMKVIPNSSERNTRNEIQRFYTFLKLNEQDVCRTRLNMVLNGFRQFYHESNRVREQWNVNLQIVL